MKKLVKAVIAGCMLALVFGFPSKAQIELPDVIVNRPEELSKITVIFNKLFTNAEHPHWYYRNNKFVVAFRMNNVRNNALFTRNGKLLHHIRYGDRKLLPAELTKPVDQILSGYEIISVINVLQDGRSIWLITGQGIFDFINISIENGKVSEPVITKRYSEPTFFVRQRKMTDISI